MAKNKVALDNPVVEDDRRVLRAARNIELVGLPEADRASYGSAYANTAFPAAIATYCLPLTE